MAVRYLIETYGPQSAKEVVVEIGRGFSLPNAIKTVTGLELAVFESNFNSWLISWEDPARASVAAYLSALERLVSDQDAILDQRSKDLDTSMTADEAAISRAFLANATQGVINALQGLAPPERALALHQEAADYFLRVLDWLTSEFQYADTLDDAKRRAANKMLPEVNGRKFLLQRNLANLQFIHHLGE